MLILMRRTGESVMIADAVTVEVLGVKRNQVCVGVDGPKHVPVHREEIYVRIKCNEAAGLRFASPRSIAPAGEAGVVNGPYHQT